MEQRYSVYIEKTALKALKKIDRRNREKIQCAISSLAFDPRPAGVRKLTASNSLYRIRIGEYRAIYRIEDDRLFVLVVKIASRGHVYKNL